MREGFSIKVLLITIGIGLSCDGSRLISSLLKREKHDVTFVTLPRANKNLRSQVSGNDKELESLNDLIRSVDVVLISVYTAYVLRAIQITTHVRTVNPSCLVLWGGPHCVSAPEIPLEYADIVCFSEGDECIPEFFKNLEKGDDSYYSTPNMAFKRDGKIVKNKVLAPFSVLDSLPEYDYDLNSQYVLDDDLVELNKDVFLKYLPKYPYFEIGPTLSILTMRGCPHSCSYCNSCRYIELFGKNTIRFQSVNRFLTELEDLLKKMPFVERLFISDDDFMARSVKDIEEFSGRYRKNIALPFTICASANTFRKEKFEILLDAGLNRLQIGIQSGSERILKDVYNRGIDLNKTIKTIDVMLSYQRSNNLKILTDFIVDNPYEKHADITHTRQCIEKLPAGVNVAIYKLAFFPGSPIFERALNDGFINKYDPCDLREYHDSFKHQINFDSFLLYLITYLQNKSFKRGLMFQLFLILTNPVFRISFDILPKKLRLVFLKKAPNLLFPVFNFIGTRL